VLAPALLAVLRALHGASSPELGDLLQESLVAVLGALPRFRGEASVLHFARQITVKRALDARRRARTIANLAEAVAREAAPYVEAPPDEVVSARLRAALRRLMGELPDEQAEALAMRVVLGHSVAEISSASSVPLNTVRSRLLLAKKALRARIVGDPALRELAGAEEVEP
jgi:RNA polymerase sigma-70 factor (ECF subfamily)